MSILRTLAWFLVPTLALLGVACQAPPATGDPVPPPPAVGEGGEVIPSYPDLEGAWTAVMQAIFTGQGPHTLGSATDGPQLDYLRLTINIDVQDGRLFWGRISSVAAEEPVAGSIREGGRKAIYITRSGRGEMWLDPATPDQIEVCGGRGNAETMMALCGRLERVR